MKIACMFSIGYRVNSNSPSIVLSWLLCFWLHSVMVLRFAPDLRINIKRLFFFFLIALLGCDPAVQHWELDQSCSQRKRSLTRDKTNKAKNRTTLPGQTENTSRWRISHKGLQTEQHTLRAEQLRVIKCIPEQKKHGRKLSKADGEKRARCLPQSGSILYLPVCVCALQQWSAFLSTTEPLTLHTDLLTALGSQWQLLPKLLWKNSFGESRLFVHSARLSSPTAQTGWWGFFWNKSAEEEWIFFF